MYSEFLRTIARWFIQVVVAFAIGIAILSAMHAAMDHAKGDVAARKSYFSSRPDKVYPAPDRIRFIHSDPFSSRTFELKATVSMLIRRGEWRGVDVTVYNTSHFYWWPADDFDCPYIMVNAVRNSRGFYEIDSIEDYSGDKIKPFSLRKPEDEKETFPE